ncbi:MAG: hypothetical protein NVS2B17_13400 [Candidatus Velthaea sp.]
MGVGVGVTDGDELGAADGAGLGDEDKIVTETLATLSFLSVTVTMQFPLCLGVTVYITDFCPPAVGSTVGEDDVGVTETQAGAETAAV